MSEKKLPQDDATIIKEKELVDLINSVIVFLDNHHYDTEPLRKTTEEYLELIAIDNTDLSLKIINLENKASLKKYDEIIKTIKYDAEKIKETHPRVSQGLMRAIMLIKEATEPDK